MPPRPLAPSPFPRGYPHLPVPAQTLTHRLRRPSCALSPAQASAPSVGPWGCLWVPPHSAPARCGCLPHQLGLSHPPGLPQGAPPCSTPSNGSRAPCSGERGKEQASWFYKGCQHRRASAPPQLNCSFLLERWIPDSGYTRTPWEAYRAVSPQANRKQH